MPFESEAKRRLFYAAASGKRTKAKGLSAEEAKKFIEHSGHQKRLIKRVKDKLDKTFKRGRYSGKKNSKTHKG